jgi:hypothetical protein
MKFMEHVGRDALDEGEIFCFIVYRRDGEIPATKRCHLATELS